MFMADYHHFSLRFSYDKPEHRKVIDALEEIDRTQYSSKTHFIICAIEHYIKWLSLDDNERWELVRQKKGDGDYVTKKELEEVYEVLKASIKADVYEKMIQYMSGGACSGTTNQNGEKNMPSSGYNEGAQDSSGNLAGDLSQYAGVMESVLSWSEDE